ncbi:MAG: signal recognition particle-docking protein FtsY [Ignavibacteriaceae bacterium]|nr:signal recognition particle-docking protein FtsY [Ignavibacteriaceae bacterium]
MNMKIFSNISERLSKTRNNIINRIKETVSGKAALDNSILERLEEILISADIGYSLTDKIIENVRIEMLNIRDRTNEEIIFDVVKKELKKIFTNNFPADQSNINHNSLHLVLVLGVNGVGKTTTVGKLAYNFRQRGKKVLIAASDTFRAAAGEQLDTWSTRADADIYLSDDSNDPSSVTFEAIERALNENYDVLFVDTAGRLHNKKYLMDELAKLNRIIQKKLNSDNFETLLVLDGTSGQNAVFQVEEFSKVAKISGLVITKLDGTSKGGIVFQISEKFKIPVKYIGIGEGLEDLRPFDKDEFISAIVSNE